MRHPLLALAALAALSGCTDLPDLQANRVCGNGILEPDNNEDCEPGKAIADGLLCGEVGDELACKFVCADDEGQGIRLAGCPLGWGCALEGFCQPPSGAFEDPEVVTGITTPLGIGDFDGDDFPDLATVQEPVLRVAYGNADGLYSVNLVAPIDASPSDPSVVDMTGDGRSDIIVFSGSRVSVYLGEADQTLTALMVPSLIYTELPLLFRLVAVTMNEFFERQLPILIGRDEEAGSLVIGRADRDLADQDLLTIASPGTLLQDAVATGDLLPDGNQEPLRDMAIAPFRGNQIVIVTLVCETSEDIFEDPFVEPECELEESLRIPTPGRWQLSRDGTFAADIDGDMILDLVFGLQGPEGHAVGAALGDGAGFGDAFVLPVPVEELDARPIAPMAQEMVAAPAYLLGVADLDSDGNADIITGLGIFHAFDVGDGQLEYFETFAPDRRWTSARTADVNRDEAIDIVAITGPSLVINLNVDGYLFNSAEVTLDEDDVDLYIGDFDGDLMDDLLLGVGGRVLLGFNDGRGLPTTAQEALSLNANIELTPLRWTNDIDATTDVAMIVREPDLPPYLIELQGSGTRRLAAPLDLYADAVGEAIEIAGVITVQGPDNASRGLVGERSAGFWAFRAVDRNSVFTALSNEPPIVDQAGDCDFDPSADLLTRSFKTTPDDDWSQAATVETESLSVPMPFAGPFVPRVVRYQDGDPMTCIALDPSPFESAPTELRVADIDGDDRPDLLIAHPTIKRPMLDEVTPGGLSVYWGDGDGGFAPSPEVLVPIANVTTGSNRSGTFEGEFATLQTDSQRGHELAMLFDNGMHLLTYDPDARDFGEPVALLKQRLDTEDIRRVDAVDLDIDGVDDIVLSGPRRTVLLKQLPCGSLEAAEGECDRTVRTPGGKEQ